MFCGISIIIYTLSLTSKNNGQSALNVLWVSFDKGNHRISNMLSDAILACSNSIWFQQLFIPDPVPFLRYDDEI